MIAGILCKPIPKRLEIYSSFELKEMDANNVALAMVPRLDLPLIEQAERDAKIVDAIHYARYALVRYHSLPVTMEGEQFDMDFSLEIAKLTEAMELLRIDTSNGLIAPPFPGEREG